MLSRFPRIARTSALPALSSTSRGHIQSFRAASTHSAHDDHGHGHGAAHGEHGHDDHFDPPSGWLWGQRPGEKYEKEGWEPFAWIFTASWIIAIAAYTMKEDTSIQTWALEEARRRLEKEGFYDESK
ncbi:NADH:ubiquinone oxidoreductase 11.6kD subunit [Exophiala viscosa]|uniref:NADH dehydrogenase [ubiquinone] 1 beta subcomplex subunit 11, mitochondrial n=1 Tax=Exophiala viscosa TaxID=2486360 RepID=A0AAN6DVT1_9EURO|nr:NADH:ubiquinone oxidoreductase 11.6kD subunit [Exophiala viscosa]